METNNKDERRRHTRVDFLTRIVLKSKDLEIVAKGSSKDLSLKGVFFNTEEKLAKGSKVSVKIILSGGDEGIELAMESIVARVEEHGLGLKFQTMDLDSYTHLKNIVLYNKEDSDEI
ncbi:MAG: PilZ domain-containing protein [Thermodesulfobacteriota bacterium]|nr:PilZ domain-containing protein [Thermodesulfobacteriota bacterium]